MRAIKIPMLFMTILLFLGAGMYSGVHGATLSYSNASAASEPLSVDEEADLLFMREEEKLARDVYLTFYELYADQVVFSNIASSEQMHMNALLKLLKKYDLPDPVAGNGIGEFTDEGLQTLYFDLINLGQTGADDGEKRLNALKVGGLIEEKDMVDIQAAIDRSEHADIDLVYASLLCGSRNHLRGFAQTILAQFNVTYVLQWPESDPAEINAILSSPMEKCGKNASPAPRECKGKCLGWMK